MIKGALSRQEIFDLIKNKVIISDAEIPQENIQPGSIDLRITEGEAFRLPATFLPSKTESIKEFAANLCKKNNFSTIRLGKEGVFLEVGIPYLVPIAERLNLPKEICAKANNKSSSGRINLQARLLCEKHQEFDTVPFGYKGPLYILLVSNSFPIHIKPGEVINQMRFFNARMTETELKYDELKALHEEKGLVYSLEGQKKEWESVSVINDGIVLTADLKQPIAAYRAKDVATHALDLKDRNANHLDFYEPIRNGNNADFIVLAKGGFYILSSNEAFSVPPEYCSEMVAYSVEAGEYRSHFAGFFDPGWGYENGQHGAAPGVLEIIAYEDMLLYHGQPVCAMTLNKMTEIPDKIYGELNNNYHMQKGPRLSKHFGTV